MKGFLTKGTLYKSKTKFLIEDIIFEKSHFRNFTQLADSVAYCIRRKYRDSNSYIDVKMNDFYTEIEPKFDTDASGNYLGSGLKIFP